MGEDPQTRAIRKPGSTSPPTPMTGPTTVVEPMGPTQASAPVVTPATRPLTVAETSTTTPADALRLDELARTRHFATFGIVVGLSGFGSLFLLPLTTLQMIVTIASMIASGLSMSYLMWATAAPGRAGAGVGVAWFASTTAVAAALPVFGVFSAVLGIAIVGIYFMGLGASRRLAFAIYATNSGVQLVGAVLIIAGTIDDPGVMAIDGLSRGQLAFLEVVIQVVFAATLWLARASRVSTVHTVEALERAVRQVAAREALLEEAQQELARVLEPGGAGRFTDQIVGSFRLGGLIGRGGMGEVYEATHTTTGDAAAVKLLTRAAIRDAAIVRRFLRELQTSAQIDSPHVVRVLEVGEAPLPYLAMERLHGDDLATLLRRRGALPDAELVDLVRQLGEGIAAATRLGVVHRDLKPQNVFLAGRTWKLLDFGVAKLVEHDDSTVGLVVGTPAYMAPEQASGQPVDHRADLYALGAIVYRAITGRPPFVRQDAAAMLYEVVHAMPPRPGALAEVMPADVDALLAIALAKRPDDRLGSGAELADALERALRGELPDELRRRARSLVLARPWAAS